MTFHGSYEEKDVTFLLKPSDLEFTDVEQKEKLIQQGVKHYSEMLSEEGVPGPDYMSLYFDCLRENSARLHGDVIRLCNLIKTEIGQKITLVSLARAGTPIGVLMQRYLCKEGYDSKHYSISIIRGRGIDQNALKTIIAERGGDTIVFVDGWTGKGAITNELKASLANTTIKPRLAVIADPAGCATYAATIEDYVIPSGILNGIVSGLISRTVLNDEIVGRDDYHAVLYQEHLSKYDQSREFIDFVEKTNPVFIGDEWRQEKTLETSIKAKESLKYITEKHNIKDINLIKPGIAESTRAILRRVPNHVYVRDINDKDVKHIVFLCKNSDIQPKILPSKFPYRAITVIRELSE